MTSDGHDSQAPYKGTCEDSTSSYKGADMRAARQDLYNNAYKKRYKKRWSVLVGLRVIILNALQSNRIQADSCECVCGCAQVCVCVSMSRLCQSV